MKTRTLLFCIATLPLILLSSCASGEYKLESKQGEDHPAYETWNTLPKNS